MEKFLTSKISIVVFIIAVAAYQCFFVLPEGRQAIITQFGRPVGEAKTNAGVHFKLPVIQKVILLDKRILVWDGDPEQIPTKDKKFISVDTTARWRILDPLKFIMAVESERGARNRLDTILDGVTRDTISKYNLVEAVRNTNDILAVKEKSQENQEEDGLGEEEIFGELESIEQGRENISREIVSQADQELRNLGIELIDVQLRRIAYESSVEKKVFSRMISERNRIAEKIRSIGKGEQAKIRGKISKTLQDIEAKAYKESQIIRGKADAKAAAIYAKSLNQAPAFYEFVRKMEAYESTMVNKAEMILSTDSEFLKGLSKP